ncbi:hypothetical protein CPT_Slocum_013 [Serratia phage Slocum]|nr:hypothetical protein CPT_Slocum_013 [Serratia phage Slocum]
MRLDVISGLPGSRTMRYGGMRNMALGNRASFNHTRKYMTHTIEKAYEKYMCLSDLREMLDEMEDRLDSKQEFTVAIYAPNAYFSEEGHDLILAHWDGKASHVGIYSDDVDDSKFTVVNDGTSMRFVLDSLDERQHFGDVGFEICGISDFVVLFSTKKHDILPFEERHGVSYMMAHIDEGIDVMDVDDANICDKNEAKEEKALAIEEKQAHNEQAVKTESTTQKETVIMTKIAKVVELNKSAALSAARITAGKIAIKNVTKIVGGKLPLMVRGYADTAIGQLVIANIVKFAVDQYAANNKNAVLVADAMVEGAMIAALEGLDIEGLIDGLLKGVNLDSLTAPATAAE